jgi:hypothetical protein
VASEIAPPRPPGARFKLNDVEDLSTMCDGNTSADSSTNFTQRNRCKVRSLRAEGDGACGGRAA